MSVIANLKAQISALQEQIEEIQEQCSHPSACVTKKRGSDTGNFCPSDDSYWTDFHCTLCDKRWTEPGSK